MGRELKYNLVLGATLVEGLHTAALKRIRKRDYRLASQVPLQVILVARNGARKLLHTRTTPAMPTHFKKFAAARSRMIIALTMSSKLIRDIFWVIKVVNN